LGSPTQAPPEHWSLKVQLSPSSQAPPLFVGVATQVPVLGWHCPTWHSESSAEQSMGPPRQKPATQVVWTVQGSPSSHGVPSGCPVQAVRQDGSVVPVHTPAEQVSPVVQLSPSSQVAPLLAGWLRHTPLAGSQLPTVQSLSSAEQSRGLPWHAPAWQVVLTVQGSPSSHGVPSATPAQELPPLTQAGSSWPVQAPPEHTSLVVQLSPSSHTPPSLAAVARHAPLAGSHTPTAQSLSRAEQSLGCPAQAPAWQVVWTVQGSPSSHGVPSAAPAQLAPPLTQEGTAAPTHCPARQALSLIPI